MQGSALFFFPCRTDLSFSCFDLTGFCGLRFGCCIVLDLEFCLGGLYLLCDFT